MLSRILTTMSTRKCHGCDDKDFHTHHFTWIGRHRYIHTKNG